MVLYRGIEQFYILIKAVFVLFFFALDFSCLAGCLLLIIIVVVLLSCVSTDFVLTKKVIVPIDGNWPNYARYYHV